MPKSHAKLHNINSPIDHFKMDGLFNLKTGLGMITAAGDDSIKFTASPLLATDPVFQIFDRVAGASAPLFTVDGTGAVSFTRTSALPVTADITGTDALWNINNDGSAMFDGDVTINGNLIGATIIDSLNEVLDPSFGVPQPDRNKAYVKDMYLFDDVSPGTVNAFSVVVASTLVTIGDVTKAYDFLLNGSQSIVGDLVTAGVPFLEIDGGTTPPASDAIVITNTNAAQNDVTADNWSVSQLGKGYFNWIELTTGGTDEAIFITHSGVLPAIDIVQTAGGVDIRNSTDIWQIRSEGSAAFAIAGNPGVAITGIAGATGAGLSITNGGTGTGITLTQTGATADAVSLTNSGATNAIRPAGWKGFQKLDARRKRLHVQASRAQQARQSFADRFFVVHDGNQGPGFAHSRER